MKKKIVAIFLTALSIAFLCLVLAPNVKADASDVKILSYNWYISPADSYMNYAGDFIVLGEIQNIGTSPLDLPFIRAIAYTKDGEAAAVMYNSAWVKYLLPQQKAAFYLDFTAQSSLPEGNYSGTLNWIPVFDHVEVFPGYANSTADQMYRGLAILAKTSYHVSGTPYTVTGIIQNNGSEPSGKLWAVTTFYNSTGSAIAVNVTNFLADSLAPNQTIPFTATPMDNTAALSSQIESYSILIQNMPYDASAIASPTPSSSQTPNTSPEASPSGSEQPEQTSSPKPFSISSDILYAIIGAIVIAVAIVAMLFIRKKTNVIYKNLASLTGRLFFLFFKNTYPGY